MSFDWVIVAQDKKPQYSVSADNGPCSKQVKLLSFDSSCKLGVSWERRRHVEAECTRSGNRKDGGGGFSESCAWREVEHGSRVNALGKLDVSGPFHICESRALALKSFG